MAHKKYNGIIEKKGDFVMRKIMIIYAFAFLAVTTNHVPVCLEQGLFGPCFYKVISEAAAFFPNVKEV